MNLETYKTNKKLIGSIIKLNRINKNFSQKELSKGICVPSYLSRIENGDLIPSEEVLAFLFDKLGLKFNDSKEFLQNSSNHFEMLFDKLNYNEFDETNKIFAQLEKNEEQYITSPLIIHYFLAKLARYSSTRERDKFESSKNMLLSAFDLLSSKQKFLYNFYVGIDLLNLSTDKQKGKSYIEGALKYRETGHCYYWLSYAYRTENNAIKAYDCIKKALDFYVNEGNIISIMSSYEKLAEVYFMLDNYNDGIHYLQMALKIASKINNPYFIEHINSLISWTYFKMNQYEKSLEYMSFNSGVIDHRMIIPDSVTENLIYFSLKDKSSLEKNIFKLMNEQTQLHITTELASSLFNFFNIYMNEDDYRTNEAIEKLLLFIIERCHNLVELKKHFILILKDYYIYNRKYKDALYI